MFLGFYDLHQKKYWVNFIQILLDKVQNVEGLMYYQMFEDGSSDGDSVKSWSSSSKLIKKYKRSGGKKIKSSDRAGLGLVLYNGPKSSVQFKAQARNV